MKYRTEIDGLRALAVLPVIFYHAGFKAFSGGFVGVDVFFVISGYLITGILVQELEGEKFSLIRFYERRCRRILPALCLVAFSTIPLSLYFLPPEELDAYFKSLIALGLFSSNILFWQESNYFDAEASDKPLLHTWSLAVEEQFYLLFPLLLIAIWRFDRRLVFSIIFLAGVISLFLSEWGWRNSPVANFYLSPTRAWELLLGSLVALHVNKKRIYSNNLISIFGFICIVYSVFAFDEATPTPSIATLLPTVGAALIIAFGGTGTIVARALSIKPLVGIGLISYSAYLWHQPTIVFTKLYLLGPITPLVSITAVSFSLLLAFLSWRYVEQPFRRHLYNPRRVLFTSLFILIVFVSIGAAYSLNFFPKKVVNLTWGETTHSIPAKFKGLESEGKNCSDRHPKNSCTFGQSQDQVIFIGDSHARVLTEAFQERSISKRFKFIEMTASGCPFLLGTSVFVNGQEHEVCTKEYQEERRAFLQQLKPSVVVLHARFSLYLHGSGFDNGLGGIEPAKNYTVGVTGLETEDTRKKLFANALFDTIAAIQRAGHQVVLVTPVPTNGWHPSKRLIRMSSRFGNLELGEVRSLMAIPKTAVTARHQSFTRLVQSIEMKFNSVLIVDSSKSFCDQSYCHSISKNGEILYSDRDHLSYVGAKMLFAKIFGTICKVSNQYNQNC